MKKTKAVSRGGRRPSASSTSSVRQRDRKETRASRTSSNASVSYFSNAGKALVAVFTSPYLLLVLLMQLAFIYGVLFIGSVAIALTLNALSLNGSALVAFMELLTFIFNFPTSAEQGIPAAFVSYNTLKSTVADSVLSGGGLIIALVITVIMLIAVLALSYTKALALTAIRDRADGRRTGFMDLFRGARQYWKPSMWYYGLFGLFALAFVLVAIPAFVLLIGAYMLGDQAVQSIPAIAYLLLGIGVIAVLVRLLTVFADHVIVRGSHSPVRDSIRFAKNAPVTTLATVVGLLVVAAIIFYCTKGLSVVAGSASELFANLLWIIVFAAWRYWVSAFVVFQGDSRSRAQRTPRA